MSLMQADEVLITRQHFENLSGDHLGKIRVCFELAPTEAGLVPSFECVTCADLLVGRLFASDLECVHCGYCLKAAQACEVIDQASQMLKTFRKDFEKKVVKKWDLVTWLRGLLRKAA